MPTMGAVMKLSAVEMLALGDWRDRTLAEQVHTTAKPSRYQTVEHDMPKTVKLRLSIGLGILLTHQSCGGNPGLEI